MDDPQDDRMLDLKSQCGNLEKIHVSDNEGCSSSLVVFWNLFITKNIGFEEFKTLFDVTQKLILECKREMKLICTIEWQSTTCMRSILLHDRVIKLSKTTEHVYSDSVFCLRKMYPQPLVVDEWKENPEYFQNSNECWEFFGIDREPFELEWNIVPRHTAVQILQEIHLKLEQCGIRPLVFEDRIIFMSFQRHRLDKSQKCQWIFFELTEVKDYAKCIEMGHVLFLVLEMKKNGTERTTTNLKDYGFLPLLWLSSNSKKADIQFSEHPMRWIDDFLRTQSGTYSMHFSGDTTNADLLFRTRNSANKLSVHGAVADWCDALIQQIFDQSCSTIENSIAKVNEQLNRKLAPEEVNTLVKAPEIDVRASRKRLCVHQEKFEKLSKEEWLKPAKKRDTWGKLLLDNASGPSTILMMELEENRSILRVHITSWPGWIRGLTKIVPVIQVRATYFPKQHWIEIQ